MSIAPDIVKVRSREVKTFEIDCPCPECSLGDMRPTGKVLLSYPPKYVHGCTKCDYLKSFKRKYPYIKYD